MEQGFEESPELRAEDEASFPEHPQDQDKDSELKEEVPLKIPADFLNMVSMPGNWEQVERLKSKRQMLGRNLFSHMRKFSDMNSQNKKKADLDNEDIDIDVETVSVKNNDDTVSERNDLSITFTSIEASSSDEDDSSDGSILSLKIVEDEECDNDIDQSDIEDHCDVVVCLSPQEAKSDGKMKAASESEAAKVEDQVLQLEQQHFDDKSDLCQLSASDINNSLFDTIASLKQQNPPKANPKKQSSLENIITRIKTDFECNKYHIPKPGSSERVSSPINSRSEDSLQLSVKRLSNTHTAPEESIHSLQNKPNPKTAVKGNKSQGQLLSQPRSVVESSDGKQKCKVSSTVEDQEWRSVETCPLKVKLKRYLRTQQAIRDQSKTTHTEGHNTNSEHQEKDQCKDRDVKHVNDKLEMKTTCEPCSNGKTDKGVSLGRSGGIENDNTSHSAKSPNSIDDMFKLKSEYYESKLKVLEYETQLIGLKEKLLAKQSMQQYFEALKTRYPCNRGHDINSWVAMSKADVISKTCQQTTTLGNEKQITSSSKEVHPCSTAGPGSVQCDTIPKLVHSNENERPVAPPCMEISNAEKQQPSAPQLHTETTKSDRTEAEHRSKMPVNKPDRLPCQVQKEKRNEGKLADPFIVKTSTDFQRKPTRVKSELSRPQNRLGGMSIKPVVRKEEILKNKDQELHAKTPEMTAGAGVTTQTFPDKSVHSKTEFLSPEPTRPARFLNASQVDKPPSCPTIFTSSPEMSPRSLLARPVLSTTCSSSSRYAVSPWGAETGYQIPRPHRTGNTSSPSNIATSTQSTNITSTSAGKPQPLNAMQLVQLHGVAGDSNRLYAVVNNMLEPIVQKVNGQFVPVVGNKPVVPRRPTGVPAGSVTHLGLPLGPPPPYPAAGCSSTSIAAPHIQPSVNNSKSCLHLAENVVQTRGPPPPYAPTSYGSTIAAPSAIARPNVNNSSVPCTTGQCVIMGNKLDNAQAKVQTDTCQRTNGGETATNPVTLSNVPNVQQGPSQGPTVMEGPPTRKSGKPKELQMTTETPSKEYSNSSNKASPELQTRPENELLQEQLLRKRKAVQTKSSTEVAAMNMTRIQNNGAATIDSSTGNIVKEKRKKDNVCAKVETLCKDRTDGVTPSCRSDSQSCLKEKAKNSNHDSNCASRIDPWKSIIMQQGRELQSHDKEADCKRPELMGNASHDADQKSSDIQKETILTFSQGKVEKTCKFKDANNNVVSPDKKQPENITPNSSENARQRKSHVISDTLDSDDSYDSVEWEMFQNSHRTKQGQVERSKSTGNNEASVCEKKKLPLINDGSIGKKRKSMSPILQKAPSETSVASGQKQGKPDKEGHKKIVKTKLIILKGEVCERWQEIKRKTFLCEGLSDASFVHYLLNLEETRQAKIAHMHHQYKKQQSEKNTGQAVGCNGDASHSSSHTSVVSPLTAKKFAETKPASADRGTTPLSAWKKRKGEPTKNKKRGDGETPSKSQSPKLTRSGRNVEKPERYRVQQPETDGPPVPVLPAEKRNLKRKLESTTSEASETASSNKRGRFEFLSETIKRQMSWALSVFMDWLEGRGDDYLSVYMQDSGWLDKKLQQFYVHAHTLDGFPYPSRILQTFRRALSMCLTMFSDKATIQIGISLDIAFSLSNNILANIMRYEEENGDLSVKLAEPLCRADLDKLYSTETLSDKDPTCLQWKVFYDIVQHLCQPKMPWNFLEMLEKHNLTLESDIKGVYYSFTDVGYVPACDTLGRMYATPSDPDRCPVRSASLYLSKLSPDCPALFQRPVPQSLTEDDTLTQWYLPVIMKKAELNTLMEHISRQAKLSKVYTLADVMATPTVKKEAVSS